MVDAKLACPGFVTAFRYISLTIACFQTRLIASDLLSRGRPYIYTVQTTGSSPVNDREALIGGNTRKIGKRHALQRASTPLKILVLSHITVWSRADTPSAACNRSHRFNKTSAVQTGRAYHTP